MTGKTRLTLLAVAVLFLALPPATGAPAESQSSPRASAAGKGARPAEASGSSWRRPWAYDPFRGPADLVLDPARTTGKAIPIPVVRIEVRDTGGKPVPGVGVQVKAHSKKGQVRATGATGEDGVATLRAAKIPGLEDLQFRFRWHGGNRIVGVYLEPSKSSWKITRAPYENVAEDEKPEGSCRNLFRLTREASGGYVLQFLLPDSLLACEEISYGVARKSGTFADVGKIGSRDLNRGDRNFFGEGSESDLGMEAAKAFDGQLEVLDDREITGYVAGVLDRIVAASDDPSMDIRLRVVHTGDLNAFATAGGNVYVFTGLIESAQNEAQLAGVLAHELSHVLSRHVTEGMTRGLKQQLGTLLGAFALGTALDLDDRQQAALLQGGMLTTGLVGMKYDRRAETEADLLGMQYLWKAGWDPEALSQFFGILEEKYGSGGPGWMSDHPTHERRVKNGILWSRAFLPDRDRYLVDTQAFRDARERVRRLPPPRKKTGNGEAASFRGLLQRSQGYQSALDRELEEILGRPIEVTPDE